MIPTWWLGRGS